MTIAHKYILCISTLYFPFNLNKNSKTNTQLSDFLLIKQAYKMLTKNVYTIVLWQLSKYRDVHLISNRI